MNKKGFITLDCVTKFYCCTKTNLLKAITLGKLNVKKFEGDSKIYVNRKEIQKLYRHRKTNKGKDNG